MPNKILIGDAGGSTTEWRLIEGASIRQVTTNGFNFTTHSLELFYDEIFNLQLKADRLYLYVAGAERADDRQQIAEKMMKIFDHVEVENDLLGAARSVLCKQAGYVGILGTGSNAAFYDGAVLKRVGYSLGYLIGDEGSGAYLGKMILKEALRGRLENNLQENFNKFHHLSSQETIMNLHKESRPNLYLAQFAKFLSLHSNHPQVYSMVYHGFEKFFEAFFNGQPLDHPIHFVGSIAYHFNDILRQVGADLGIHIQHIVESPIAGLVTYHNES